MIEVIKGWYLGSRRPIVLYMLILLITTVLFGLAALGFGTDSRPGFDERRDGERFGALR
ncbi:MAG: hypothetical protein QOE65_1543 [Solirubrobacteraceae bacterium]|jgi:hypothetical protein|nr:hypothetical protein [Solirubrobacteraceae bacterium]